MHKIYKKGLFIIGALLLAMLFAPKQSQAQWPPFRFNLIPLHEDGQITYYVEFRDRVDWLMTDVTIKVPLPEGTRFLEVDAIPTVDASFDGSEVTFFIPAASRKVEADDAFFIVDVTDPNMTVFETHAWITWQGDQPGDYLAEDVSIDITQQTLNWEEPARSHLQIETRASVADDVITYFIYPKNVWRRMWDVEINIPTPVGTTFLSADAPSPFVANFDGREVSFSTIELAPWADVGPLSFNVSAKEFTGPFVTTHVWATWKNVGRKVGRSVVLQEEIVTGDIMVQPQAAQWIVSDAVGDVPFSNYDVTNVALQEVALPTGERALKINFYMVENLDSNDDPIRFNFFIDNDCRSDSGQKQNQLGVEYQIVYRHDKGRADIKLWTEAEAGWNWKKIKVNIPADGKIVTMWVPYELLADGRQFCWMAEVRNNSKLFVQPRPYHGSDSKLFAQHLPVDKIPDGLNSEFSRYEFSAPATKVEAEEAQIFATGPQRAKGILIDVGDTWQYLPGWSAPPPGWNGVDFDDGDWYSGATTIGYGSGKYATNLSRVTSSLENEDGPKLIRHVDERAGMIVAMLPSGNESPSVFMRRAFTIVDPTQITQLSLAIEYEGGFVAYLNGDEIARRGFGNAGQNISYDILAADREAGISKEIVDLSPYIPELNIGFNVLAIQIHRSTGSSDLSINPKLSWSFNPADVPADTSSLDDISNEPKVSTESLTPPAITDIGGKLAIPLDNGHVNYDIHVFSMPNGQEIARIPNARQPNFRFDGQRILINREGGGIENVYEYSFIDGTERQVSDAPQDWHPFYDPWGNRVVYGNLELTVGQALPKYDESGEPIIHEKTGKTATYGPRQPFIFVQCGLLPPHKETEPRCRDIPSLGVLVPAGQVGEIQGTHPVWTSNDMIAYKGCNTWVGSALCGIFIVPSSSTKGFSDGLIPRQLTRDTSDTPTDTKGDLIAFMSQRDGDWETYVMDLNGAGVTNLSRSPDSNDGLPTISPDAHWVAFVSDRDGQWAVWATPIIGGSTQKLFDLPVDIPWGDGKRSWTNERISWGP